jgi:outer membrane protein TolC
MKRLILTCICSLAVPAAASAQAIRLTLAEAIERGLGASHRLEELVAREDAARAVEQQRSAADFPVLSAIGSYARTNHVNEFAIPTPDGGSRLIYPDIPDRWRSRVDLQWPIYTAGRLQALTRAAGADAAAVGQDRETLRADLRLEITRAYLAVVTARASETVVQQALDRTNAHLADVRSQFNVGLVPPSDVLSIEAQQAHQQMLAIEAANIVVTSSADFRRLVGIDPDVSFELADELEAPGDATSEPSSTLVAEARANRPERKALQFRIDAASERASASSASAFPTVTALGGVDFARPNPLIFPLSAEWRSSWDLGLQVRWTFLDGGRVKSETAEATALRRAVEARLRDFDSGMASEIEQRTADLRSAQAAIAAASSGVRAAAEARRVLAERFSAGVATNTDVLTAQVTLLQAELDLTRALANTRLARARLERARGN